MVPTVKLYLVGGYLRDDSPRKDIDIIGVLSKREFELTFGYTHQTLQEAYRDEVKTPKFKEYLMANRVTGWLLSQWMDKRVDFKWNPPTMLYNPHALLHLELDVTMYL